MKRSIKVLISLALLFAEYIFMAVLYPGLQEKFAMMQGDASDAAFNGLQMLQFAYSYLWIPVIIIVILIWKKELTAIIGRPN